MNDQSLMIRNDAALKISFSEVAIALKDSALASAALIGRVSNAQENTQAAEAQAKLAEIRRAVEKARKDAKEPYLEAGRKIDAQAKVFVDEIAAEEARITKLLGDFFQLEEAKRRAAEAAARLEAERIEHERRAEEARIHREEQERLAAIKREEERLAREKVEREAAAKCEADEADRKIREAANAKAREEAERQAAALKKKQETEAKKAREEAERAAIELRRQQEIAHAKTHEALDAAQERACNAQAAVISASPAPVRADGQVVKNDWEIEVTDIWLLARTHPTCVKIEPRNSEIKELLKAGVKVAGVRATPIMKASGRAPRQMAAIEV